jgi:hypothetical protein
MSINKLKVRFFGIKRPWGSSSRIDNVVAVDDNSYDTGVLQVALLYKAEMGAFVTIPTSSLGYLWGASSSSPQLLTGVEVLNPNGSAATFRLAIMTTPTGSPDAGQAFLAWDTNVSAHSVFKWTGNVPLIDRYIYGQGSISGLIFYFDVTSIDPV